MKKSTERSVEEIVEEFGRFTVMDGNKIHLHGDAKMAEDWLTQTLQTERQKREEVVEAERERIALIVRSIDFEVRQTDTRVEAAIWQSIKNLKETVLQALTQPDNPK